MATSESKYCMSMDMNVLNHLGLNLYSNTSAVISEVVANSWDADATDVQISLTPDSITIHDNGNGMGLRDINEKYLCVGYQKRVQNAISAVYKRKVMGRKGIGKLSLFSIANDITILTCKDGEKNALRMTSDSLIETVKLNQKYYPEELSIDFVDFDDNGTTIILKDLKKSRTTALSSSLKKRIARRFSVISKDDHFQVSINGEYITVEDRAYLSKAQLLWYYLRRDDAGNIIQADDYYTKQCGKNMVVHNNRSGIIDIEGRLVYVYGWIATAKETGDLKDDESINRISVMVRGKMAKEDILSSVESTSLYTKYLFGEIHADFLDDDDNDDITTSSRQDFFDGDIRYRKLIEFIKNELTIVKKDWEEYRGTLGAEEACKYTVINSWYNELGPDDKSAAKKLFGKINQLTIDSEEKKNLFKHSILAFNSLKLKNELSALESLDSSNIDSFVRVAGRLEDIEAIYYYQIVLQRIAVIQRLQEAVKENELEEVLQKLIADNLWLLDPSWDRGTELPKVEEAVKTQFDTINGSLTQEEKDARFDIRYKKTSKKHIIIELKRGKRTVKSTEITTQIQKYHSAMVKILEDHGISDEPFEIIVIIGKKLDGVNFNQTHYNRTVDALKCYNTRILFYDELLLNAETLYKEYLEKHKELDTLKNVLSEA